MPRKNEVILNDCASIEAWVGQRWKSLASARILVTGGTGFIGVWILQALAFVRLRQRLDLEVWILSRDPASFSRRHADLASTPGFTLIQGDVRTFIPPPGRFTHVIHGATDSNAALSRQDPQLVADTVVGGTRRVLELARERGATRTLFLSSGAVYGRPPLISGGIHEETGSGPDVMDPLQSYHEAKRYAELLCTLAGRQHGLPGIVIARLFAFVGPWLPIDRHFAVGNFIRDALGGGPIRVAGDGSAVRSYLYAADLTAWLWRLLIDGPVLVPVNVGSPVAVTIRELAEAVAQAAGPGIQVVIEGHPGVPSFPYLPDTSRASDLGLAAWTGLPEALKRTICWHRSGTGAGGASP